MIFKPLKGPLFLFKFVPHLEIDPGKYLGYVITAGMRIPASTQYIKFSVALEAKVVRE
jgi:hypothetical protein